MKINKDDCPSYLNDYLMYLKIVKGRSERTVSEYFLDLRLFLRYLKLKKNKLPENTNFSDIAIKDVSIEMLQQFTLQDAYEYLYFVANERSNQAIARARKASSIRGFFHYLTINVGLIKNDPVKDLEMASSKKSLPKFLSLEKSIDMLSSVNSTEPLRDYCIITLFLNCGMRLSELVGLNIYDVNTNEHTMRLLGKGNKERIIYINEACISAIKTYVDSRKNPQNEPNALFLSKQNKRIGKRRVQQIVENTLKNAGLDNQGLSTHKLRHTAATLMYQHGNVDTLVLKEILGHKSIATTEIYTHISNDKMKNAAESSPLSGVKIDIIKKISNDKKIKDDE